MTKTANSRLLAARLAVFIPLALYGGALISQFGFGLFPCEMCYWQRWWHQAAIVLAVMALLLSRNAAAMRSFTLFAMLAILGSGLTGLFHAGVEYGFWPGPACSSGNSGPVSIEDLMKSAIISCDKPQWEMLGISLAGFNALFSIGGAMIILRLLTRTGKAHP